MYCHTFHVGQYLSIATASHAPPVTPNPDAPPPWWRLLFASARKGEHDAGICFLFVILFIAYSFFSCLVLCFSFDICFVLLCYFFFFFCFFDSLCCFMLSLSFVFFVLCFCFVFVLLISCFLFHIFMFSFAFLLFFNDNS